MCISQMLSKHVLYGSIDNDIYIEVEIWVDIWAYPTGGRAKISPIFSDLKYSNPGQFSL